MSSAITGKKLGLLGGGQLGRMMVLEAQKLGGIEMLILDAEGSPAMQCVDGRSSKGLVGQFNKIEDVKRLTQSCDRVTVEIEHVDVDGLLQGEESDKVHPSVTTLKTIQDKYTQKAYLLERGIRIVDSIPFDTVEALVRDMKDRHWTWPIMLKTRRGAYDGRGNIVVHEESQLEAGIRHLGSRNLYAERMIELCRELAVMVVKQGHTIKTYPVVETVQKSSICHLVIAPAQINGQTAEKALQMARDVVACFSGNGVYGVEMFLDFTGQLYFNEIAPRPHNSGHYTIEACQTSQFENAIRAVLDLPLGGTEMIVPAAIMLNVLGADDSTRRTTLAPCERALKIAGASVHLYGKKGFKPGRKMGHITVVGDSMAEALKKVETILGEHQKMPVNAFDRVLRDDHGFSCNPVVGIIMGSDSDLPKMLDASKLLQLFETQYKVSVSFELTIVSAHRTPERLVEYAKTARERGIKVIIAGAGGAAHLPGMVAAMTTVPVVGVPIMGSTLGGIDSLLSICQMPRGVPVATVAVNNSTNAALLALRMLSIGSNSIADALERYNADMKQGVLDKLDGFNRASDV